MLIGNIICVFTLEILENEKHFFLYNVNEQLIFILSISALYGLGPCIVIDFSNATVFEDGTKMVCLPSSFMFDSFNKIYYYWVSSD